MDNITRTVAAAMNQTANYIGVPTPVITNSTLNEKLDILRTDRPGPNENPSISMFVWGNMGHDFTRGADGFARNLIIPHSATDFGLYNILPFVLRELNNDISAAQRALFALRKVVEINNRVYVAYYGRRINKEGVVPIATYVTVNADGTEKHNTFVAGENNLNPIRPAMNNEGVWVNSADYVTVKARLELLLQESDLTEMRNVARAIYGHESYAILSEVGVCSGVDRVINVSSSGGVNFNFKEVICAQIASHMSANYDLQHASEYVSIAVDVGANEPLYKITPYDTVANSNSRISLQSVNGFPSI